MSAFSNVDAAAEPARLFTSLANSARGLASMKHYMAAAHASHGGTVLDVGCGAGHDMAVLETLGVRSVGVDPSGTMLGDVRLRSTAPTVRGAGERLPFADGSFSGCWIERVLMHVADPRAVLDEAVRCVAPGGLMTIFEPDWSSLTVNEDAIPLRWTTMARHPSIGAEVGSLLESLGCFVRDRVEERSWWTFPQFEAITNRAISRATDNSGVAAEVADWAERVRLSAEQGRFKAEMVKLLWVATTPSP